jgi:hypothetical protein
VCARARRGASAAGACICARLGGGGGTRPLEAIRMRARLTRKSPLKCESVPVVPITDDTPLSVPVHNAPT